MVNLDIPVNRTVRHCGTAFEVSPFDIYAACPTCGTRIKLRGFSGNAEAEDVFDAVFAWMARPGAEAWVRKRRAELAADDDSQ